MRKSRLSGEKIVGVVREWETVARAGEVRRRHGIRGTACGCCRSR